MNTALKLIFTVAIIFFPATSAVSQPIAPEGWKEQSRFEWILSKPKPSRTDELSGFIPFSRNYMDPIYRNSRPGREEITDHFQVTLARNEYEPFVVALYAIENIEDIRLEISNVKSESLEIPIHRFEVRKIESQAVLAEGSKKKDKRYRLIPSLLRLSSSADLHWGRTTAFWITVHAAKEDHPEIYHGEIIISSKGKVLRTLSLEVRILPFALEELPDRTFSVLYTPADLSSKMERNARLLLKDMRSHGMTSYSPIVSAWGEPLGFDGNGRPKVENLISHLQWAKEEGFQQPTLLNINKLIRTGRPRNDANYKKFDPLVDVPNMKKLVAYLEQERNNNLWPEIIYIPVDEPGCFTDEAGTQREEIAVHLLRELSKLNVRGATTVADLVDNKHRKLPRWKNVAGWWEKMRPYCSVRIYANGYPEGPTSLSAEMKDADLRGHEVMLYENKATMGMNPNISRIYFGFYGWRTGASGITAWTHPLLGNATGFHVWADQEEKRREKKSYFRDENWKLPPSTVCWEMAREGIDDAKYLYLFEKALKRNKAFDKEYESLINELIKAVDKIKMSSKKPDCNWNGERFYYFRQKLVQAILELDQRKIGS